jgi:Ca2+-binding EF-hand superfamily protein
MPPKGPKKPKRTNKPSPLERMKEAFALVHIDPETSDVTLEDFTKAMASIGVGEGVARQLFGRFDPDGNGVLDKDEFFSYAAKGGGEIRGLIRKGILEADEGFDKVIEIFKAWDVDGDGTITKQELERVLVMLNPSFTKKELDKVFKAADKNGDGKIDYEEFADWLQDGPGKK